MKGILIEIDMGKLSSSCFNPIIKARLELSAKQMKAYNLETIQERLDRAASIRETLLQLKEEKLRSISQERENKVRRKESYEENEKQENVAKFVAEQEEAEKRRNLRRQEMIMRLQEKHERILKTAAEVNKRKEEQASQLKTRIIGKLEDYETQRERGKKERVKRLETYHSKLAEAVQAAKTKKQKKVIEIATAAERKQLQAQENRLKHIQGIKALAEEIADKVKKIQEFVYDSECL